VFEIPLQHDLKIGIIHSPTQNAKDFAQILAKHVSLSPPSWIAETGELSNESSPSIGPDIAGTALIITVGGDGTILRAARAASPYGIPLVGVNLGRLGFMTELGIGNALENISRYFHHENVTVENRSMVRVTVRSHLGDITLDALNDVVVGRAGPPRLLHLDVSLNGVDLTRYSADAVVVATATGSTGYALAAGGPILHSASSDVLVIPVAPHVSLSTPLVLPGDTTIGLRVATATPAVVSVDGLTDIQIDSDAEIEIYNSPYQARFLRANEPRHFYATLIQRLGLVPGAKT
jgi:NAD+ kinase